MRRPRMKVNRPIFPDFPFTWNPHLNVAHLKHGRVKTRDNWAICRGVEDSIKIYAGPRLIDMLS